MKLTKEQKNQIYNKNMIVDDWEWVPCINHVLRVLNYDDNLIHDENYETVKWSGTEPLIKNEKDRKAVRAFSEAIQEKKHILVIKDCGFGRAEFSNGANYWIRLPLDEETMDALKNRTYYTITELCGEEEE